MLQSQCRRLEAQNYNLSLTAEQLSHTMGVRDADGTILKFNHGFMVHHIQSLLHMYEGVCIQLHLTKILALDAPDFHFRSRCFYKICLFVGDTFNHRLFLFAQELMSQRQKLAVEREKIQAELEHFRKCLTLPQTHWPRGGHYKGYPPR